MAALAQQFVNFPAFLATWLTFFAAGAITFAIQWYLNRRDLSLRLFIRHLFPFEAWSSKSAHTDLKVYAIRKLTDKFFEIIPIICTAAVAAHIGSLLKGFMPEHVTAEPTYIVIVSCAILLFMIAEFSDYLTHYIQHHVPFFWELHKVHHSALFLNPFTVKRGHPVAYILERATSGILTGIPAGLFAFLYGLNLTEMAFLAACASKAGSIGTLDVLKHSHFPVNFGWLDKLLMSPHMHQIHHSSLVHHWDRNFGTNLSLWDWMFGTAYQPVKGEKIVYGISGFSEKDHAAYDTLFGVYVRPLMKMWRMVATRPSAIKGEA